MGSSFSMVGGGMSPEDICVICGESGVDEETGVEQVQICPIGHYAHVDCITPWYAKADTCPECRVNVRDFPLWKDINPQEPALHVLPALPDLHVLPAPTPVPLPSGNILADFDNNEFEPGYDFSDPEQLINANRRFTTMIAQNDYDTALEYFYSPEGDAFVRYLLDEDMRRYQYLINVDEEDPDNVLMNSLMYSIVRDGKMNVAEALYDYARSNDLLYDLHESSGAIINKFADNFNYDRDQDVLYWLWSRGFGVGFWFLESAALETKNADAVKWYLTYVKPSTNDEQLIELFDAVGSDTIDEQDAVYAALDRYFNINMQAGQYGGMWQRGGFFMTCS